MVPVQVCGLGAQPAAAILIPTETAAVIQYRLTNQLCHVYEGLIQRLVLRGLLGAPAAAWYQRELGKAGSEDRSAGTWGQ